MKHKKNLLIVGGTGFIGYHLAKKALLTGWRVTSVSTGYPKKTRYLSEVKYILCDITKKKLLKKKIQKNFKYIVNLGGYVDHSNKKKTFESHYIGCKNLVEFFLNKKIISFVQMGSSIEYGNISSPQKENVKTNLNSVKSIYGKAKLLASKYLIDLFKNKKFPCVVLRLYLSFGPKQDLNRFMPIIIDGCLKNKKFPCSKGNQQRDFVYVDDVVDAIIKSLTNKDARGQIINIGSGKPRQIRGIIKYIKKISKGGNPQFGKIKLRKDEILKLYPSIRKAKKIIKWKPKISFVDGIKSTIKYYEQTTI